MLTQIEYQWIWWAYIASGSVFLMTFFIMIRKLKWITLKSLVVAMLGVIVFTPVLIAQNEWRAPAVLVLTLDTLVADGEASLQVTQLLGKNLLLVMAFVVLVSLFFRLIFRK